MTSCSLPCWVTARGADEHLVARVCAVCPNSRPGGLVKAETRHLVSPVTPRLVRGLAVLGVDPGQHMGLAVVKDGQVRWAEQLDWTKRPAAELVHLVERALAEGVRYAVVEVLGNTSGDARAWASSWAVMSRTAGRAIQECERQGLPVLECDPGTWREAIGLPRSFGKPKEKDKAARSYAKDLMGLAGKSAHVCEAALMGLAGSVVGFLDKASGVLAQVEAGVSP